MDYFTLRQQLIALIRKQSYREGDFTLASGRKSTFYIDLKATTLHPEGAYLIGELAVELLRQKEIEVDAVGGLTLGADPLATAVSLAGRAHGYFWPAFIVRKEPKDHGTTRYIEGIENLRPGARILVLEDVVTTGGSSVKAIERLRDEGFNPVAVLTVVDREQGGTEAFAAMKVSLLNLATISEIKKLPSQSGAVDQHDR
ncbi:MAG TPA: orotate phosphoribosyltransferase [Bdellovibrionales bacterium]|nr:MAG: orotate phosphoribosyltransferase [Bdellovibrionales bacterium GWB1_52_6]OFZ06017.1 MAG: orotate phosphoribosyltransferase [Bdellovibrionales bacterium GWA1_52_35]OFZ39859.1 MAG: orotate phosphoribosyltransferase [Bdellovibrionales bacterium GWC1_52_8]HAR42359.1 orotate phosphoribosyltransferase [Bdellovibrionales bacterium]HCM39358.1 orotate phosphoribosyltransferase [Bdellovibrionales bacterium]